MLTGCADIGEKVGNMIENDANIGKNAPAVGITLTGIETTSAESETTAETADNREDKLYAKAEELLSGMTADEKLGQLLLARMPENSKAAAEMEKYSFGGYTMYAENFQSDNPETIAALNKEISEKVGIDPFIAVDEEGGTVVRVSKYPAYRSEPFSSVQLLYGRGGAELLEIDTEEKSKLLRSLGINMNLAPVADISSDESSYIYPRTVGQNAEQTAEAVGAIVKTAADNRVASCLKHFPGYGENTDTHKETAHDSRELYEFYNRDFLPFSAGINAAEGKTPAVMIGHTVYDSIDPDYPASLSETIHSILREKLEFDGVILSDDMGMDAVSEFTGEESVYVRGILAGSDMLCVTDYETAYSELKAAYENGTITDEIIDSHIMRILVMKLSFGIIK